jgi:hypothetical protein
MTKKAHKALLKSIEHWHENLDMLILNYLSGNKDLIEDVSSSGRDCALCVQFSPTCHNCPIRDTGYSDCFETPYEDFRIFSDTYLKVEADRQYDFNNFYEAAAKELEFLYSLLYKDGF